MSTLTSGTSSLPDVPAELSRGSSVSTEFENEYKQILQHAIVAPKFQVPNNFYEMKGDDTSIENENTEECLHKAELKISEATQAVGKKKMMDTKRLRFQVPTSALDSLLEYSNTPIKGDRTLKARNDYDSTDSTPDTSGDYNSSPSVDKDLIRMDGLMDEWTLQLKRNVLAELADIKRRQCQYTEATINEVNIKQNTVISKLGHEVDNLKEMLYSFEQSVKQKDEVIKNLTDALGKQKGKSDKIRMFSMWRLKHNVEQRQEFAAKMAEKFYKRTLVMKVWVGWRSVVESRWKQRVEKACQIKSQEVCLKLTADYEERLQALHAELASTRAEVAKMHKERDCYEENMKKAFMRGVCALNMEAMSMFHEGKNANDTPDSSNHYPCNGPGISPSASLQYETANSNTISMPDLNKAANNSGKNVTFRDFSTTLSGANTAVQSTTRTTIAPSRPSSSLKNLHVKVTGKKDLSLSGKNTLIGSGCQSSISSVKVERHVPVDHKAAVPSKNNTNKYYSKDTAEESFQFKRPMSRVPAVKVVE